MSDRTKQVQFRMPADTHKRLKLALVANESSLADFFNEAADRYLKSNGIKVVTAEIKPECEEE